MYLVALFSSELQFLRDPVLHLVGITRELLQGLLVSQSDAGNIQFNNNKC